MKRFAFLLLVTTFLLAICLATATTLSTFRTLPDQTSLMNFQKWNESIRKANRNYADHPHHNNYFVDNYEFAMLHESVDATKRIAGLWTEKGLAGVPDRNNPGVSTVDNIHLIEVLVQVLAQIKSLDSERKDEELERQVYSYLKIALDKLNASQLRELKKNEMYGVLRNDLLMLLNDEDRSDFSKVLANNPDTLPVPAENEGEGEGHHVGMTLGTFTALANHKSLMNFDKYNDTISKVNPDYADNPHHNNYLLRFYESAALYGLEEDKGHIAQLWTEKGLAGVPNRESSAVATVDKKQYIKVLVDVLGLENLDSEIKRQVYSTLKVYLDSLDGAEHRELNADTMHEDLRRNILKRLTDDDRRDFEKALENNSAPLPVAADNANHEHDHDRSGFSNPMNSTELEYLFKKANSTLGDGLDIMYLGELWQGMQYRGLEQSHKAAYENLLALWKNAHAKWAVQPGKKEWKKVSYVEVIQALVKLLKDSDLTDEQKDQVYLYLHVILDLRGATVLTETTLRSNPELRKDLLSVLTENDKGRYSILIPALGSGDTTDLEHLAKALQQTEN